MAAVPQKTLNWLYGVLGREYRDQNRAYNDIAQTLAQYPTLAPRTDVYTYEHGAPALLLQLTGVIPVEFRTETYRFPITIWLPHAYPLEAPMVYVTPTEGMIVRPGQHVGGEGKVYHHFLAHWREAWDRATIVEFLRILASVFAKEPPIMARPQYTNKPPSEQQFTRLPPAIPPVPLNPQSPPSGQNTHGSGPTSPPPPLSDQNMYSSGPTPPPPPPKRREDDRSSIGSQTARPGRYDAPPPLPPEVGNAIRSTQGNASGPRSFRTQNRLPQRQSSLSHSMIVQGAPHPHAVSQYQQHPNQYPPPQAPRQNSIPPQQYQNPQGQQPLSPQYSQAPNQQYGSASYQAQPGSIPPRGPQYPAQRAPGTYSQPLPQPQKPPPPPSLLDSPFDISLPITSTLPAPPVPRNPEKDHLLSTLSTTLTQTLHTSLASNASALPSLHAQHTALASTYHALQAELANLTTLNTTLSTNNTILSTSLQRSDHAIASARSRAAKDDIPKVDEMVTAPTVVGRQLYDVVCEERGLEAGIWALQEGFVGGRIGSEVWSKQTRSLAREGFRKRYLAAKVGRGMGLDT